MLRVYDNLIIDSDADAANKISDPRELLLITCGLKQNSSVTASSIGDDGFLYCIQRGFRTRGGNALLPQEFKVRWSKKRDNIYPCLEFVTALLLSDMSPSDISEFFIL